MRFHKQVKSHLNLDINNTSLLAKVIPNCTDDYCNYNGACIIVDKYLTCDCDYQFTGTNCQVDTSGLSALKTMYQTLYTTTIQLISSNTTALTDLMTVVGNLLKGASKFTDDPTFLTNVFNFITLIQTKYPTTLINNIDIVFDYYNSILGYLLYQ